MKKTVAMGLAGALLLAAAFLWGSGSAPQYGALAGAKDTTETVTYTYRVEINSVLDSVFPAFVDTGGNYNTCANTAGATVLGYYDQFYSDLMPGSAMRNQNGIRYFIWQSSEIQSTIDELYIRMQTNVAGPGTTSNEFLSGMSSYCSARGKRTMYTEVGSGRGVNVSAVKDAFTYGRPVTVFLSSCSLAAEINVNFGTDRIYKMDYSTPHVMTAFGYRKVMYHRYETKQVWKPLWYNLFNVETVTEDVEFRTDEYLLVATGDNVVRTGFLYLNNTKVDRAVSVSIQ